MHVFCTHFALYPCFDFCMTQHNNNAAINMIVDDALASAGINVMHVK